MLRRIALIVPIRFAVRAFLQTEIYERLLNQAQLLIISPFAMSETFRYRFNQVGTEHVLMRHFHPSGFHAVLHGVRSGAWAYRRGLKCLGIKRDIEDYYFDKTGYSRYRLLKRFARKRLLPLLAGNRLGVAVLDRAEMNAYRNANYDQHSYYRDILSNYMPDLVVSTSPNRPQEMPVARAIQEFNIPHIACVLSFDNIVCYDPFPRIYDHYLVWNERNRQELLNLYPHLEPSRIKICGPIQFDFYFNAEKYTWSRSEWAKRNQLDETRPVLLYAETGHAIAPHEPEIVGDLCQRLQSWDSRLRPQILVRLHPMYTGERWAEVQKRYPDVRFQATNQIRPGESSFDFQDNVEWSDDDLSLLISTLQYSDVHLNVASTMTLDAAYFDRPIIGIAYDPRPGKPYERICKELYLREHYVDITHSGGLALATSPDQVLEYIRRYLKNPKLDTNARRQMLQSYDPFLDGRAASRVADFIIEMLSRIS